MTIETVNEFDNRFIIFGHVDSCQENTNLTRMLLMGDGKKITFEATYYKDQNAGFVLTIRKSKRRKYNSCMIIGNRK